MKLFGFQITRDNQEKNTTAIAPSTNNDGASEINSNMYGFYNAVISQDASAIGDEIQLITKYRELAEQPEAKKAIDDIINEAFSYGENKMPVSVDMSQIKPDILSDKIKEQISEEFDYLLNLMNFKNDCYEIFRRWYVDGRLFYEKVINKESPSDGITELRYVDPRTIKKIKEVQSNNKNAVLKDGSNLETNNISLKTTIATYYIYNPTGINHNNVQGIKIAPDSIAYTNSGVLDKTNTVIISYLHTALKPYNQYKMMKDSMVIYYHTRAPERRIFNVEVGQLPKIKSEQYMKEIISKFKRKNVYDPSTGDIKDDKKYMTMNEDFWFPTRDGKGTKVDILSGGTNLQEISDVVNMYKNELYEALNVPISRYSENSAFNLGRSSEITRDELKFGKFITRLRIKFSSLFDDILKTQLILKNIITEEEWDEIKNDINFDFQQDTFFSELKMGEIWENRINNFRDLEPYIGQYFSKKWAINNVLHISDEEWNEMDVEMKKEQEKDLKKQAELEKKLPKQEPDQYEGELDRNVNPQEQPIDDTMNGSIPENLKNNK